MATNPKILFLDEPAAGMNPQETADLTKLIHKIKEEDVYKRQNKGFDILYLILFKDSNTVYAITNNK